MDIKFLGMRMPEKRSFIDILHQVQNGDKLLRNQFISDYRPFIIKSVSQILNNRYIDIENSEEYSIGLIAFNEAIDKYKDDKKCAFKKFSYQVIQRRLIDYRRQQKNNIAIPFSSFETDETGDFEEKFLKSDTFDHVYHLEIREEFSSLIRKLDDYGISLNDLVKTMPKHKDSRKTCVKIAKYIVEDKNLYDKFKIKKTIPFKNLEKYIDVSQRTVERNRKYIITLALILKSDLEIIKDYIDKFE